MNDMVHQKQTEVYHNGDFESLNIEKTDYETGFEIYKSYDTDYDDSTDFNVYINSGINFEDNDSKLIGRNKNNILYSPSSIAGYFGNSISGFGNYQLGSIINEVKNSGISSKVVDKHIRIYGSNTAVQTYFGRNIRKASVSSIDNIILNTTNNYANKLLGDVKLIDVLEVTDNVDGVIKYGDVAKSSLNYKDGIFGFKNFAKKLPVEKIAKGLDILEVGIDVYQGVKENVESNADASEFVTDAFVDTSLAVSSIAISNIFMGLMAGFVSSMAVGLLPVILVVATGIVSGVVVSSAFNKKINKGKSIKEKIKDGAKYIFEETGLNHVCNSIGNGLERIFGGDK
jgi:hypothetical protein